MLVAYVSHPVSGDVAGNLARAELWLEFLQRTYPDRAFVAPWIDWLRVCGDNDSDPAARELGLQRCEAVARTCHEIWLVGLRVSDGMQREIAPFPEGAIRRDHLGALEPPARAVVEPDAATIRDAIVRLAKLGMREASVLYPGMGMSQLEAAVSLTSRAALCIATDGPWEG